jgi:hypothetical protein
MGYCIELRKESFWILAKNKPMALANIKELANHPEWMHGGRWEGGRQTKRWYSWTDTNEYLNASTLEDALLAWGWEAYVSPFNGDIDGIRFLGEKIGQEEILFNAIAPFVESGSYIEMEGEDGEIWRWAFENGELDEIQATISFHKVS